MDATVRSGNLQEAYEQLVDDTHVEQVRRDLEGLANNQLTAIAAEGDDVRSTAAAALLWERGLLHRKSC